MLLSPLQLLDAVWVDCCVSSVRVSRRLHASRTGSYLILSTTPGMTFFFTVRIAFLLLPSCCCCVLLLSKHHAVDHRLSAAFPAPCCLLLLLLFSSDRRCCCILFSRASLWFSFVITRCASVGAVTVIVDKLLIVLLNCIFHY